MPNDINRSTQITTLGNEQLEVDNHVRQRIDEAAEALSSAADVASGTCETNRWSGLVVAAARWTESPAWPSQNPATPLGPATRRLSGALVSDHEPSGRMNP
jgi:hypothetical protein